MSQKNLKLHDAYKLVINWDIGELNLLNTYDDGTSSYYAYILRDRSKYVWFGNFPVGMDSGAGSWGNLAQDRDFESLLAPVAIRIALIERNNITAPSILGISRPSIIFSLQ